MSSTFRPFETSNAFSPPSLRDLTEAPVFFLLAGRSRPRRAYRRRLVVEGLRFHDRDAIRAELLRALEQLQAPEIFAEQQPRIEALWFAIDAHQAAYADAIDPPAFEHPDLAAVDETSRRVAEDWAPLRRMAADNIAFAEDAGAITVAVLLRGVKNVPVSVQPSREIPLETLDEIEAALGDIEKAAGKTPGLAWAELLTECTGRLFRLNASPDGSVADDKSVDGNVPAVDSALETVGC